MLQRYACLTAPSDKYLMSQSHGSNSVHGVLCRHDRDDVLKLKLSIRNGKKKGDLSDFECGVVVGARWAGLSIS